jgi:hypothetical protein
MIMKLKIIFAIIPSILPLSIAAQETQSALVEGNSYRLEKTISLELVSEAYGDQGCTVSSENPSNAGRASKFEVVKKEDGCDVIRFWSVFENSSTDNENLVKEDLEYVLPNRINGVPIEASTSTSGKTSGLLVLPYKYRTDDGSVTGEATVGYYAGWEFSFATLIASAGLSQVSLPVSETETENQSAVTLAGGVLLNNWDNVDIGLVIGIDHIGGNKGDTWQYEDDPWFSIMVGWNFSQ